MTQNEKVTINIKYKGIEQEFTAAPQEAWLLLNQFFKELIPAFDLAENLTLKVDLQQLARDLEGIVAFSGDGASLLVPKNKLTDNEALLLWLLAAYFGHKLGLVKSEYVSKADLQAKLGKSAKIVSTRLGELVKGEAAARTADDRFRITEFGVVMTQKEALPKIKAKIAS
ncbi:MAG: hypothetical protein NWE98_08030 [Candidatus Bathyarchaeota archaeon]|nr:hypothetical protein [Candidatus Bathyarchaeota archaeon]